MPDPSANARYRTTPKRRLADDLWCQSCEHTHIAYIPGTTFACADCGFGAWDEAIAESHATLFPAHVVHPLVHEMTTLDRSPSHA